MSSSEGPMLKCLALGRSTGTADMNWTTEKPTQPGWYWLRNLIGLEIVKVWDTRRGLRVGFLNGNRCFLKMDIAGEWAGPLEPPPSSSCSSKDSEDPKDDEDGDRHAQ